MGKTKKGKDAQFILTDIPMNCDYGRQVLRGIYKYLQPDRTWQIIDAESFDVGKTYLIEADAFGIITMRSPKEYARIAERYGKIVVSVGEQVPNMKSPGLRHVGLDLKALGEMAAEHFIERGFRNFGAVASNKIGPPLLFHSHYRGAGFVNALRRRKFTCDTFDPKKKYLRKGEPLPPVSTSPMVEHAHRWLMRMPKPAAVFCFDDYAGGCLIDLCRRSGVRVPEEVALLCVDNGMFCEMVCPHLSSIVVPAEQIGYEAVKMFDKIIHNPKSSKRPVLLPPLGVVTRQSTDVTAIDDLYVIAALKYIREHAHKGMRVEEVIEELHISRRMLERRFKAILGRSPFAEIRRLQIERIKMILVQTDKTLETIAYECGFESVTRMTLAFKKAVNMPPGAYRKQF